MAKPLFLLFLVLPFLATGVWAADIEQGQALFLDPLLGGGTSGKTCNTCHANGRDLGPDLATRKDFRVMGIEMKGLEEVINFCIEVTLRGWGLDPKGREMADLKGFVISLGKAKRREGV